MEHDFKDWYLRAHRDLMNYAGDHVFIGLLASTSPRKSLKANLNLTKKLYYNYLMGITPIFKGVAGILHNHKPNIERVINGHAPRGDKVYRFYKNLMGDLYTVTIDTWIKRYYKTKPYLSPLQYRKLERKIKRNARRHGLRPAEYQAVIWNIQRAREGFRPTYLEVV